MQGPQDALFPRSLLDELLANPDTPAFERGDRVVTRGELLALIRRLASALTHAGLGAGDGVAIFTAVSPEAFAAQMAAHVLGCRVVGVRPGYTPRQLAHVLSLQLETLIIDSSTLTGELLEAAAGVRVLSLGPCASATDLMSLAETGRTGEVVARPDAIALVCFTSGSTGQPKGCALTYRALSQHWSWRAPRGWSPVAGSLAAAFGRYLLFGTLASLVVFEFLALCLLGGGTAVIPDADVGPIFPHAIERYRITGSIITVPRLYRMLDVLSAGSVDVSSLRGLMVSGSPLSPRRLAAAVARLGPVIYQGYGQTEAGSISMLTPADISQGSALALSSVGRPHPSVEVSVRNEAGEAVADGQVGEVYVKSPYSMTQYWAEPDETRATLDQGWLRTRDLGYLDDAGFLHLVGRTRDVIMVNALVVYAGPIEALLASHPSVDEAYVTGAPDEQTGEAIHAFVVLKTGRTLDPEPLKSLVRSELGNDSVPRTITQISSVPVAPSGKPDKRALLDLLRLDTV